MLTRGTPSWSHFSPLWLNCVTLTKSDRVIRFPSPSPLWLSNPILGSVITLWTKKAKSQEDLGDKLLWIREQLWRRWRRGGKGHWGTLEGASWDLDRWTGLSVSPRHDTSCPALDRQEEGKGHVSFHFVHLQPLSQWLKPCWNLKLFHFSVLCHFHRTFFWP